MGVVLVDLGVVLCVGWLGFFGFVVVMLFFLEFYFNVDNGYLEGLVCGLKVGVFS